MLLLHGCLLVLIALSHLSTSSSLPTPQAMNQYRVRFLLDPWRNFFTLIYYNEPNSQLPVLEEKREWTEMENIDKDADLEPGPYDLTLPMDWNLYDPVIQIPTELDDKSYLLTNNGRYFSQSEIMKLGQDITNTKIEKKHKSPFQQRYSLGSYQDNVSLLRKSKDEIKPDITVAKRILHPQLYFSEPPRTPKLLSQSSKKTRVHSHRRQNKRFKHKDILRILRYMEMLTPEEEKKEEEPTMDVQIEATPTRPTTSGSMFPERQHQSTLSIALDLDVISTLLAKQKQRRDRKNKLQELYNKGRK